MTEDQERELLTELRDLQRRLYGPGAEGIPSEADVARLAELEGLLAVSQHAEQPSKDSDDSPGEEHEGMQPFPRRALVSAVLIGAASVVVASVLSGYAGWNLARASDSGVPLAVSTKQEWPASFGVPLEGQKVRYADYYGVQVGVIRGGPMETELSQACLLVDAGSGVRGSCAITEFGGSVDVVVDATTPEKLRAKYAESTVLRFSLRDGNPYVRSSSSPPA